MATLKDTITEDSKAALRSGDKSRLGALRLILAGIKQQEVDTRSELDDTAILDLVSKMIKKGRDAAEQFAAAGRSDLAEKEQAEIAIFEVYMPTALSDSELSAIISDAIKNAGADSLRDMGKVMAAVKTAAAGRADMSQVSGLVRAALS